MNHNFNLSLGDGAPRWLLAAILAVTYAAELLDHLPTTEPTVTAAECNDLCNGLVKGWGPAYCTCALADVTPGAKWQD